MSEPVLINVGDTDENADWILTPEKREEELALFDAVAEKGGPGSGQWGHHGYPGIGGGQGGGLGVVRGWDKWASSAEKVEAAAWANGEFGDWEKGLTAEEAGAFHKYTSINYYEYNHELRGTGERYYNQRPSSDPDLQREIGAMKGAIARHTLSESVMVRRGACASFKCFEQMKQLEPGSEFRDKGFVSTGLTMPMSKAVDFDIIVPKGSRAAWLDNVSDHPGEMELLLPPDSYFRIVKKEVKSNTAIKFTAIVLRKGGQTEKVKAGRAATACKQADRAGDGDREGRYTWEWEDIEVTVP